MTYSVIGGFKPHGKLTASMFDFWFAYISLRNCEVKLMYMTRQLVTDKYNRHVLRKEFRDLCPVLETYEVFVVAIPTNVKEIALLTVNDVISSLERPNKYGVVTTQRGNMIVTTQRGNMDYDTIPYNVEQQLYRMRINVARPINRRT
jgi:hypothetical protein